MNLFVSLCYAFQIMDSSFQVLSAKSKYFIFWMHLKLLDEITPKRQILNQEGKKNIQRFNIEKIQRIETLKNCHADYSTKISNTTRKSLVLTKFRAYGRSECWRGLTDSSIHQNQNPNNSIKPLRSLGS